MDLHTVTLPVHALWWQGLVMYILCPITIITLEESWIPIHILHMSAYSYTHLMPPSIKWNLNKVYLMQNRKYRWVSLLKIVNSHQYEQMRRIVTSFLGVYTTYLIRICSIDISYIRKWVTQQNYLSPMFEKGTKFQSSVVQGTIQLQQLCQRHRLIEMFVIIKLITPTLNQFTHKKNMGKFPCNVTR